MKKYYQTLDKEKKREIKEVYEKEYKKTDVYVRLKRLFVYAIISIITALVIVIISYFYEEEHLTSIIMALILVFMAIVFLIGRFLIKLDLLNRIALKSKNLKKKKD